MSKSTDVAQRDSSTEVEALSPEEQALIDANQSEVNSEDFVVPLLKVAQPLTNEVSDGLASPGDFVLSLTGESFGPTVEFIVAGKGKGRFKPGRDGERSKVAYDTSIVPWQDDPHFGEPFADHPDAEEKYRERVNDGDIEWGSGPPIQTTFNYTGYVVGSDVPVRLSLRRTSAPEARKWNTILDAVLRGKFWDKVFEIETAQNKGGKGTYYTVKVKQGRATTADERQAAVQLATVLRSAFVRTLGDDGDERAAKAPEAHGGAEV